MLEKENSSVLDEAGLKRLLLWAKQLGTAQEMHLSDIDEYGIPCRYRNLQRVGQGRFGLVFKAYDTLLARPVALKIISSPMFGKGDFLKEARAAAKVTHHAIVRVHDVQITDRGFAIIVMEFLPETLGQYLAREPRSLRAKLELIITIAEAVQVEHDAGLVHRDLKPENVLIDEYGGPKISDFGLAIRSDAPEAIDAGGTPGYMPPEQLQRNSKQIDHRVDIFALGALLHVLLTDKTPVDTEHQRNAFNGAVTEVSEVSIDRSLPGGIRRVCEQCLAPIADDRYQSAHDVAVAVRSYLLRRRLQRIAFIAVVATVAIASSWYELRKQANAEAVVQRVLDAELWNIAQALAGVDESSDRVRAVARAQLENPHTLTSEQRFRLELVTLITGDEPAEHLLVYLSSANSVEIQVASDCIRGLAAKRLYLLQQRCNAIATDKTTKSAARFRFAVLHRMIDQTSPGQLSSRHLVDWLFSEPERTRAHWARVVNALREEEFQDVIGQIQSRMGASRRAAIGIGAILAKDRPDYLCELATELQPHEHECAVDVFRKNQATLAPILRNRIAQIELHTESNEQDDSEAVNSSCVSLVLLLAAIGDDSFLHHFLSHHPDPTIRTLLIHHLRSSCVLQPQYASLLNSKDSTVASAGLLVQGLMTDVSLARRVDLARVKSLFCEHPHSGVHGAAEYCLSKWGKHDWLNRTKIQLATKGPVNGRNWFIIPEGLTFAVIHAGDSGPVDFDGTQNMWMADVFAVSTTNVTRRLYGKLLPQKNVTDLNDLPMTGLSYQESVEFCNRLSDSLGIAADCWAYCPSPDGKTWGVSEPFTRSVGFRLLTTFEWETAARAGTFTNLHIGDCRELLDNYEYFADNSDMQLQLPGQLMPNEYGLFDSLGNTFERCQNPSVDLADTNVFRGGMYRSRRDFPGISSRTTSGDSGSRFASFRVVITIRASSK